VNVKRGIAMVACALAVAAVMSIGRQACAADAAEPAQTDLGEISRTDDEKLVPVLANTLVLGLRYKHEKVRASALGTLASLRRPVEETRPPLLSILRNTGGQETQALRLAAGRALTAFGRSAVPDLLRAAEEGDAESIDLFLRSIDGRRPGSKEIVSASLMSPNRGLRVKAYGSLGVLGADAVPWLAKAVTAGDDEALSECLRGLAGAELGPEAVPVLVDVLQTGSASLRDQAVGLLAALGPAASGALPALGKLGREGGALARLRAARAMWRIAGRAEAVMAVAAALLEPGPQEDETTHSSVRVEATRLLGELGPDAREALPLLVGILREEPRWSATRLKIEVLTMLPGLGPETVGHVLPFLKDGNIRLRRAAVAAIAGYGPEVDVPAGPLVDLVRGGDPSARRHAAVALARTRNVPEDAVSPLRAAMKVEKDAETLDAMAGVLSRMGRPGTAALLEVLKCPNHRARPKASQALGKLGIDVFDDLAATLEPPRQMPRGQVGPKHYHRVVADAMSMMGAGVVPHVKDWLDSENRYKRETAFSVLARIPPEGIRVLRPFMEAPPGDEMKEHVMGALRLTDTRRPEVREMLFELASDPSSEVRRMAARSLGSHVWTVGGPESVPKLLDLLRDREPEVRKDAVRALGRIREKREVILPALIGRMSDLVPAVRVAACKALQYEGDRRVCEAMVSALFRERDPDIKRSISRCFARKIWAIPRLVQAIEGPDPKRRELAAQALRNIGPLAVVVFMEFLESKDPELREVAVEGLKAMGDLAAPALLEMLEGL
jgi:HEAT repeat protein